MNTATVTALEASNTDFSNGMSNGLSRRPMPEKPVLNGASTDPATKELRKAFQKKYRHIVAVHSQSRPSCLSHDSAQSPSFLGFRNLMVIVLGELSF